MPPSNKHLPLSFPVRVCHNNASMAEQKPEISVVGVYHVPQDEDSAREQLQEYYDKNTALATDPNVRSYIDRVVPLVIFDVSVSGLDDQFEVAHFTQEMEGAPQDAWQVAYDEASLSLDGSSVIERDLGCADGIPAGRIAFYFHYYDQSRPMKWTYGTFQCPPVKAAPERLLELLPYEPPG